MRIRAVHSRRRVARADTHDHTVAPRRPDQTDDSPVLARDIDVKTVPFTSDPDKLRDAIGVFLLRLVIVHVPRGAESGQSPAHFGLRPADALSDGGDSDRPPRQNIKAREPKVAQTNPRGLYLISRRLPLRIRFVRSAHTAPL